MTKMKNVAIVFPLYRVCFFCDMYAQPAAFDVSSVSSGTLWLEKERKKGRKEERKKERKKGRKKKKKSVSEAHNLSNQY